MSYMGSRSADAHCLSRRMTESQNPGFGHPPLQYSERHHSKPELYQKTALLLFSRTSCTEILFLTCSLNPVFIHSFFPYFFFPSIYPRDIDRIIFFFFFFRDRETPPMSESSEVQRKKVIRPELQPVAEHRPGLLTPSPHDSSATSDTIPLFCLK